MLQFWFGWLNYWTNLSLCLLPQLPLILEIGALACCYGLVKGQVVKITYSGGVVGVLKAYRCIVWSLQDFYMRSYAVMTFKYKKGSILQRFLTIKKQFLIRWGWLVYPLANRFQLHYLGDIPLAGNSLSWPVDLTWHNVDSWSQVSFFEHKCSDITLHHLPQHEFEAIFFPPGCYSRPWRL